MRTGVDGFQGQRLNQLRMAQNLTLAELGEQLGRSSSTVSAWEKGSQLPEAESFDRLCHVFNVSRMWFLKPVPPVIQESQRPYFFRSQASAHKQARERSQLYLAWLQEISDFFQEAMDWPEVNVPMLEADDCRLISDEEIEDIARECREAWKLGSAPIPNVIQVMENAGIICTRATLGHVKMDGVSHVSVLNGRPYVLIAEDKANAIRNRFDAAHELWKGRSARKWAKGEPGDDALAFEQPKLMMRGAHLLVDNGIFERTELAHQIGLPPETIEMLCNLRPGYLSV